MRRPKHRNQFFHNKKVADVAARVGRLEAALQLLGEDDPDAEPLKVALKQARMQARVRPVGERLDLCLQYVARVKKQVARAEDQVREAREALAQMEEKLANGLRDLEVLCVWRLRHSHDIAQSPAHHDKGWRWTRTRKS